MLSLVSAMCPSAWLYIPVKGFGLSRRIYINFTSFWNTNILLTPQRALSQRRVFICNCTHKDLLLWSRAPAPWHTSSSSSFAPGSPLSLATHVLEQLRTKKWERGVTCRMQRKWCVLKTCWKRNIWLESMDSKTAGCCNLFSVWDGLWVHCCF